MNTVTECQERMAEAVRSGAWREYFQARARWHELENAAPAAAPPPEHTTLQPWPEDLDVPGGPKGFLKKVEAADWEGRKGYSRGPRKSVGRGVYRTHDFVVIQAQRGSQAVWARWCKPVVEGARKASWSFDAGMVNSRHVETLKEIVDALGREESPWPEKVPCGTCKTRGRIVSPAHPLETVPCPECEGAGVVQAVLIKTDGR